MKKLWVLTLFLALVPVVGVRAQSTGLSEVTLHAPRKEGRSFVSFQTGNTTAANATARYGRWDLGYGTLRVNEDFDWFQVSTAAGSRTAIRDLGAHDWNDAFTVPVVEPFPVLKEGEQRRVVVNADGADGRPGRSAGSKPGPESSGEESLMTSSISRVYISSPSVDAPGGPSYNLPVAPPAPKRTVASGPRRDGVPRVDPIFAKAVVGHVYAVHVVDGGEDFYVLFRVESLERGDNCKISWKRVPAPAADAASNN